MDELSDGGLQLVSRAFRGNGAIPQQYTCKGQNVNPPLNILHTPKDAKSLVLVMHDPDAMGSDFTHWLVWDIPTSTETIAANSVPTGALQGVNDAGGKQYFGPCPPSGTGVHHYKFELYAIDLMLGQGVGSNREALETALKGHIIEQSILTGTFSVD